MPTVTTQILAAGARGFDTNTPVSAADAHRLAAAGYTFALRYIPREVRHANDLSSQEVQRLFDAGLGVGVVQHVESESSWHPSTDKGRAYGRTAALWCGLLGMPKGVTVWLDLEGVAVGTPAETIIAYCNTWCRELEHAGYECGLYVGWRCGLTPAQLYQRLRCTRYWAAFNLNLDEYPAHCGVCMRQHVAAAPLGVSLNIDGDRVTGDALGRFPTIAVRGAPVAP